MALLADHLPKTADADAIVAAFTAAQAEAGRVLYPHQEEALLAVAAGDHVIAATPTGSGKSTIGYASLFAALARGERAFYTAPIKALVSEKFFELIELFGAENVGMATGDSSVNADAPIIVCTAEILANQALRDGETSDVGLAVMDEFHFYGDSQRGWAWQVPLIELPRTQFVLMSATLGDVSFFENDLRRRTGRAVSTISDAQRPVPLDYLWSEDPLEETIDRLLVERNAPVYIVHFTQAQALDQARALLGKDVLSKEEKEKVRLLIGDFRFSKGFGQVLSKLVRSGIGIHHAGMLPKYRRLVEKLAQSGLLKLICGTDTLGVGINVPIRTVLLTGLAKYDGRRQRVLNAREFHQIAGRAGRAGYDTVGHVVVQAPEWAIEAKKEREKQAARSTIPNNAKKKKRPVKEKVPEGKTNWTEDTFTKLISREPEALRPHMQVSYSLLLQVIARPGNAVQAMRHLLRENHLPGSAQVKLVKQACELFRSLRDAGIVKLLDEPDHLGRSIVLENELQLDFAMNQPLAPFAIAAIDVLDESSPTLTLDTVSIIEAILEDPMAILFAQQNAARASLLAELKADGVDYHERKAMLEEVTWPRPLEEELTAQLEIFKQSNPWVRDDSLSPKSIVREMYETGQTFSEFIARYQLARSEGILLRYLSDAYRTLRRTVPMELRTQELDDLIEWLGVLVRGIDSSLLDEWEMLINPEDDDVASTLRPDSPRALSGQTKVLETMVRQAMWQRVEHFAFEREERLGELDGWCGFDRDAWAEAMDDFYDAYDHVVLEGDARSKQMLHIRPENGFWFIRQTIDDPDHNRDFVMEAELDLAATDEAGEIVLRIMHVGEIR
ncbi:DEAD/DEAH box helicase [Dermabacteraceae bacterium P7006]